MPGPPQRSCSLGTLSLSLSQCGVRRANASAPSLQVKALRPLPNCRMFTVLGTDRWSLELA